MSGVSAHLMTNNNKECYDKVLSQSQTITELLMDGHYVDWKGFDLKKCSPRLEYIKVVLNTTKCTKDIGNSIMC